MATVNFTMRKVVPLTHVFVALAAFLINCCVADYNYKGRIWGDDNANNLEEYVKSMTKEWEDMVRHQDAEDMVSKYTADSVYIHKENGQVKVIRGREANKEAYEKMFSAGLADADVTVLDYGTMGNDYIFAVLHDVFCDKAGNVLDKTESLVVFRRVEEGFETMLVSEINE